MPATKTTTTKENKETAKIEYNPRWRGYALIAICSLVNFASISGIDFQSRRDLWKATMTFGLVTFSLSVLIVIHDRSRRSAESFSFSKVKGGNIEGIILVLFVYWWVIGVGYITRVDGVAYVANNIYFSAWLSLFSCIYTLNEWSASKDILSIAELTGLSATLKSWWILFLSSLVTFGTCIDLHVRLDEAEEGIKDTSFGVAVCLVSFIIALFFILVHLDFIPNCEEGGWLELCSGFLLTLLWTIFLAVATKDQGIAATVTGNKCSREDMPRLFENCTMLLWRQMGTDENGEAILVPETRVCSELPRQVPGSNLYFASWICFFASLNITFRWKAQQALQFAQAQQEKQSPQNEDDPNGDNASQDDVEDDDEL